MPSGICLWNQATPEPVDSHLRTLTCFRTLYLIKHIKSDNELYVSDTGMSTVKDAKPCRTGHIPATTRKPRTGTMPKEQPLDRRVRRTKQRLHDALESLIIEKGYNKITVQDLIDRADVGRSTFYAHYETKDDLLVSWTQLADDLELHMAHGQTDAESILPSLALFRHLAEHHHLYKAMLGSRGIDIVTEMIHSMLLHHATSELQRRSDASDETTIPIEVRAEFLAASLLALLTWWLDNNMPYPPESIDEMYQELTKT